jgi:hypothetical protein
MEKAWKTFTRKAKAEEIPLHEAVVKQFSGLKITDDQVKKSILQSGLNADKADSWTNEDIFRFSRILRQISKPMLIVANKIDIKEAQENFKMLRAEFPNLIIIPCSADSELALREAAKAYLIEYIPGETSFKIKGKLNERQKFALETIQKNVLEKFEEGTGVQSALNQAVFSLLRYIAVFPAGAHKLADREGNILPDCFLLPEGSTALDFAYAVHSDFGKNFIKAIDARTKRILGKEHKLKHRDALEIVT